MNKKAILNKVDLKRIWIIFVILISCINTFAQTPKKGFISVQPPQNVVKLNDSCTFITSRGFVGEYLSFFKDNIYQKDSILNYYNLIHDTHLYKSSLKSILKGSKQEVINNPDCKLDSAILMTHNNVRYAVIYYSKKNYKYINYTSRYDLNSNYVIGYIQYPQGQSEQGKQYFKEVLESIKFVR